MIFHKEIKTEMRRQTSKGSEELFRTTFEMSPDAICITSKTGEFIEVNPRFLELTGYGEAEVIGKTTSELIIWENPEDRIDFVCQLEENGFVNNRETLFRAKHGEIMTGLLSGRIIRLGEEDYILAVTRDITHQKKIEKEKKDLERQLQQAQKLEAIGTLAGGIAHDFNNILFPIIGFAQMTLYDLPQDSPLKENIQEILLAANRAKELVQQILTFTRSQYAEQHIKPVKLQSIIKEALKLLRSTLPTTIQIEQFVDHNAGVVQADPTQIHQVLINLCTNAFHAMRDKGGKLNVSLRQIVVRKNEQRSNPKINPGAYVKIEVADTGIGMDEETRKRIFNPYFTTKEKGEGTGLGLSVVHGIIQKHKGIIDFSSEIGKGTTFSIYLPVVDSDPIENVEVFLTVPAKGTESILLVDDDSQMLRVARQMLERLGYQVTARTNSAEALEVFRKWPDRFDLVIADLVMPNITGVELSSKLIEIHKDIRIILITGYNEGIPPEKYAFYGIKKCIQKPILIHEIASEIRKVLDNR